MNYLKIQTLIYTATCLTAIVFIPIILNNVRIVEGVFPDERVEACETNSEVGEAVEVKKVNGVWVIKPVSNIYQQSLEELEDLAIKQAQQHTR